MSSTNLLYMQDFDVEACDAKILSITPAEDDRTDIVLDQTCFYARGGGQDWDKGAIVRPDASFEVEEVRLDEDGLVHHIGKMTNGSFTKGDIVASKVDHERRTTNMRLHSAVEYSGTWQPEKAEELRTQIETLANQLIEQGSHNSLRFMPVEEMHKYCRHVPNNLPTNKPGRVVLYGDFGVPCGGTHVRDIKQVGKISIPKLK